MILRSINVVDLKFNSDDVASSKTPIAVNDPKVNASAVYTGHFLSLCYSLRQ